MLRFIRDFLGAMEKGIPVDEVTFVKRLDRDSYRYIEGDYAVEFQADMQVGHPQRVIYPTTIKRWLPPHQGEELTEADRERILAKVCRYFENCGKTYEVDRDE